ncbi:hypothetical protein BGP_0766 [Beggiatoa sp. PS]|nr:hypothetical protein BGP_0766 [Beggiatoa sp. PS]
MVAADTNVVVRFLTGDAPEQYQKAHQLFQQETVFLPNLEKVYVSKFKANQPHIE